MRRKKEALRAVFKNLTGFLLGQGVVLPRETLSRYLEWGLIRDVISSLRINCVLDVGANKGQYAKNLRAIGYGGHVFSFEPVTEAFASLAKDFGKDSRWQGHNIALGSEDATRCFNVAVMSTEMSSFLDAKDPSWLIRKDKVVVRRLDSIFDDLLNDVRDARIFMKVDTEGYDLEVVRGAKGCMERILAVQSELFLTPIYEATPTFTDAIALYDELGFRLLGLSEIARDTELGCVTAFNGLFARSAVRVHR